MYACRHFEKEFNFATRLDSPVAHHDITMQGHDETLSYFFYRTTTAATTTTGGQQLGKKSGGMKGKSMDSLHNELIANLKSFLDEQIKKKDRYRPARSGMSASQMRMHLSRIENPLKKFSNDKGRTQLMNHAKSLNFLGAKWVSQFLLREQQYTIDVLSDNGADSSFTERWQNSSELAHPLYSSEFHRIISKTTIVKFNQYLVDNQRFKKNKSGRQITNSIMPNEDDLNTWSKGWLVSVNVKELSYQLCTMSFRT